MRILFVSDLLSYGGASKLIYDLLPRMKEKGNDCELLILMDKNSKYIDELENEGVKVHIVPDSVKGHIGRIKYLKKYITDGKFDIIHANLFPTIYYCSVVKRILGKKCPPIVMTEHSTDNKRRHKSYLRPLEQFMYKPYNTVISISTKTRERLCEWLKCKDERKFIVIENGIDISSFYSAKPLQKTDIYPMYTEGDILLLTVGSFTPQKNHEKLIEALSILPENYKLILAGEGHLQDDIQNQVEQLQLTNRVTFLGFRKDIARIMHTADIMVIPSIWEGFGLIAAEAMAAGISIAASDVPGLSEVVGDAGIKFNPNCSSEIASAIREVSNNSMFLKNGIKRVSKFDISIMLDSYLNVYKKICNQDR